MFFCENKEKYLLYVLKKCCEKEHVNLFFTWEEDKMYYILIKDFQIFIYDPTVHRGINRFCRYCLEAFSTKQILKFFIKDCFKINCKERIMIHKKVNMLD